jgi:hypothetical protein
MPAEKPEQSGRGDSVVLHKRRSFAWFSMTVLAIGLAYSIGVVSDPTGRQVFSVEVPEQLAGAVGVLGALLFATGLIFRFGSLVPGAPAVVLTNEGVRNYAGLGWFPSHPFARWDEIADVRLQKRKLLGDVIVVELKARRPLVIGAQWLTKADSAWLLQELPRRQ